MAFTDYWNGARPGGGARPWPSGAGGQEGGAGNAITLIGNAITLNGNAGVGWGGVDPYWTPISRMSRSIFKKNDEC